MEASFWDVLGIAETTDERAIKRAFATRLRITSPETDAAGYMKLRDAFEAAKRHASMKRFFESSPETPPVDESEVDDRPPEATANEDPPASPQSQAFANLQVLLSEHRLDDFLQKIDDIQASQIFPTLDEQHDLIGEIAVLVQEAGIEDVAWLGSLASLLGAREHDNIFPRNTRYWHAYESLLETYAELRDATAHAHAATEDEVAATPGYLHVYHVLTAPFDSERLSALTRSSAYHRLAERILERSRNDPAIVIPAENREWWERTAMAGQHRPAEDPTAFVNPPPAEKSPGFPFWPIWILLMVVFNIVRMAANDVPSRPSNQEQARRFLDGNLLMTPNNQSQLSSQDRLLFRRIVFCDPQTRAAILSHLSKVRENPFSKDTTGAANFDATSPPPPILLDDDRVVASLLEKCKPPTP